MPTETSIGGERYLSVRWEGQGREYFYSFFDPYPMAWWPLPGALRVRRALVLLGREWLALRGPVGDLDSRSEPQFAQYLRDMVGGGALGDGKLLSNLAVGQASGDEGGRLPLAASEAA